MNVGNEDVEEDKGGSLLEPLTKKEEVKKRPSSSYKKPKNMDDLDDSSANLLGVGNIFDDEIISVSKVSSQSYQPSVQPSSEKKEDQKADDPNSKSIVRSKTKIESGI